MTAMWPRPCASRPCRPWSARGLLAEKVAGQATAAQAGDVHQLQADAVQAVGAARGQCDEVDGRQAGHDEQRCSISSAPGRNMPIMR